MMGLVFMFWYVIVIGRNCGLLLLRSALLGLMERK